MQNVTEAQLVKSLPARTAFHSSLMPSPFHMVHALPHTFQKHLQHHVKSRLAKALGKLLL